MKLSLLLPYAGRPREAVELVVACERVGLDRVWVPEVYGFDSPTLMGYIAARTERIEIAAGILNVYSRSPALIAQTAAGLDHVSGGRAIVGIGTSGPQVVEGWHGVPFTDPAARIETAIAVIRAVLRRETLTSDGVPAIPLAAGRGTGLGKALRLLNRPERADVPVFVAALAPGAVARTARLADGWLPLFFLPERAADVWGEPLASGRADRDPALGPLEVTAGGYLAIGDDVAQHFDAARRNTALYVGGMGARRRNFYNDLVTSYGYGDAAAEVQRLYLDGHIRDAEAAVPQTLLDATNLIGTKEFVRDRVAAYRAAGVTDLSVTPVGPDPVGDVARLRALIDATQ